MLRLFTAILLIAAFTPFSALAQQSESAQAPESSQVAESAEPSNSTLQTESNSESGLTAVQLSDQSAQLNVIQGVLEARLAARETLRMEINNASDDAKLELQDELQALNEDIQNIRLTFEQVAVGAVDIGVFNEESGEFNWRDEVTQVMLPIMQNLKALTEKPRKIQALKAEIATANQQSDVIDDVVAALETQIDQSDSANTRQTLTSLLQTWVDRKSETIRAVELAQVKLKNLQKNDTSVWQSFKSGLLNFITGRGLTLLLAFAAAAAVWLLMRLLSVLLLSKAKREAGDKYRTRQRLVHYAFKALTAIIMLIAVIVVFYTRGDVLLLGLALLIVAAVVLGLRNTIPKFIAETRLLLNLGSIREDERVVYNGLPYHVSSLNMYSVLRNPELTGVVRLPLESMVGMVSRPAGKETWFPASKDDYLVLDGRVLQVTELTQELVQLENLSGTKTSIPTAEFYNMSFDNLTRGSAYSISSTFGIGYQHQDISNKIIPNALKQAVAQALARTEVAEHVEGVYCELKEAGASSLDFWVCVTMSSVAARSYYMISRLIQQTCVDTCTSENWDIPFPQLTLHQQ